jgi:hypothetical protein
VTAVRPIFILCGFLLVGVGTDGWAKPGTETTKPAEAKKGPPPVVSLVQFRLWTPEGIRTIRVAHPKGWTGDYEADHRSIRLFGPNGEGEMLIAVALHGSELQGYLQDLKKRHPGSVPSPPETIEVPGIDPDDGERATRFVITGKEAGELVMIEQQGFIVFFGTLVTHDAWTDLSRQLKAAYPSVSISEPQKPPKSPKQP